MPEKTYFKTFFSLFIPLPLPPDHFFALLFQRLFFLCLHFLHLCLFLNDHPISSPHPTPPLFQPQWLRQQEGHEPSCECGHQRSLSGLRSHGSASAEGCRTGRGPGSRQRGPKPVLQHDAYRN